MSTILVAEDNDLNRALVRRFLEPLGYTVVEVADGEAAVQAALALPPDLIFMDLNMPGLSGRDAIDVLRRDSRTANTPIVALSGELPADESIEYILKPFGRDDLVAALARHGL